MAPSTHSTFHHIALMCILRLTVLPIFHSHFPPTLYTLYCAMCIIKVHLAKPSLLQSVGGEAADVSRDAQGRETCLCLCYFT